jgi:hypothetical protein
VVLWVEEHWGDVITGVEAFTLVRGSSRRGGLTNRRKRSTVGQRGLVLVGGGAVGQGGVGRCPQRKGGGDQCYFFQKPLIFTTGGIHYHSF